MTINDRPQADAALRSYREAITKNPNQSPDSSEFFAEELSDALTWALERLDQVEVEAWEQEVLAARLGPNN